MKNALYVSHLSVTNPGMLSRDCVFSACRGSALLCRRKGVLQQTSTCDCSAWTLLNYILSILDSSGTSKAITSGIEHIRLL